VEIVCCRLTPLQRSLYLHFLESKAAAALFATQKAARVLSAITSLRKLLNHPKLIWDVLNR
jgi:DNA repair and recombination RAD54-like protein